MKVASCKMNFRMSKMIRWFVTGLRGLAPGGCTLPEGLELTPWQGYLMTKIKYRN